MPRRRLYRDVPWILTRFEQSAERLLDRVRGWRLVRFRFARLLFFWFCWRLAWVGGRLDAGAGCDWLVEGRVCGLGGVALTLRVLTRCKAVSLEPAGDDAPDWGGAKLPPASGKPQINTAKATTSHFFFFFFSYLFLFSLSFSSRYSGFILHDLLFNERC